MKIYLINFSKWKDSKLKRLFAWPNESMINVKIKTLGNLTYLKVALFIFKEYFKTVIFVYLIKMLVSICLFTSVSDKLSYFLLILLPFVIEIRCLTVKDFIVRYHSHDSSPLSIYFKIV